MTNTRAHCRFLLIVFVLGGCVLFTTAAADEFFLKSGKRIEGRLLNPDQRPRVEYEIRLTTGDSQTLAAEEVVRFVPASPAKRRYLELLPKMPPTADGNWRMARWCREKGLGSERDFHLYQTIELQPDHEDAHRALGHVQRDGEWVDHDELMISRGYVRHKGRWKLTQEVAIQEEQDRIEFAQKQWRRNLRRWKKKIAKGDLDEVLGDLQSINDPFAAPMLADFLLEDANSRPLVSTLIETLGRLDAPAGNLALIRCAMLNPDEEIRHLCLESLPDSARESAFSAFLGELSNKNNTLLNRAADGLTYLKEPEAIPVLIDVLVTQHSRTIRDANPGQLGVSFGGSSDGSLGGTGLSAGGGGPVVQTEERQNRSVLEALLAVTDGVNFRYDERAWRRWLSEVNAPKDLDLRRRD